MATTAQAQASRKYDTAHTKGLYLKLNITTDADILEHLDGLENKQGYIKGLIREDIAQEGEKSMTEKEYRNLYKETKEVSQDACYMGGHNCGTCAHCREHDSKWRPFEGRYCTAAPR